MASLIKLATSSATSSFFTRLHHHPRPLSATFVSRLTPSRPASTVIIASPRIGDPPVTVEGPPRHYMLANIEIHPFQFEGDIGAAQVEKEDGEAWVTVCVPGVGPDGLLFKVEGEHDNQLQVQATAEVEVPGEEPRKYKACFEFEPRRITSLGYHGTVLLADGEFRLPYAVASFGPHGRALLADGIFRILVKYK